MIHPREGRLEVQRLETTARTGRRPPSRPDPENQAVERQWTAWRVSSRGRTSLCFALEAPTRDANDVALDPNRAAETPHIQRLRALTVMSSPENGDLLKGGQHHRRSLPILFGVVIIDLISFGIVIPILPFYADEFGASGLQLGLLLAIHAALQFICAPLWGRLSDRIGRRPVMLVTMAGTAVALLWLGLADSILGLAMARALSGLFAANVSVATAYVTDVTEESERTRYMGMIGASFGVGFLLGPALAGWLVGYSLGAPAFFGAALAGLNCIAAVFILREPERHAPTETDAGVPVQSVLSDPWIARLCSINFLFTLGVTQLESIFAYWMISRFNYDARSVAWILVAMALVMAAIQGGGMRSLATHFGERTLLLSGLCFMALAFPLIPQMHSIAWLMVPLMVSAVGRAIAQPPLMSLVSMRAEAKARGRVMGVFQSSASLARVFGPIAAGALYDFLAPTPFYFAFGCFALSTWLALRTPVGDATAAT